MCSSCRRELLPDDEAGYYAIEGIHTGDGSSYGPSVIKVMILDNRQPDFSAAQEKLACKLQLQGWSISRHSLAKLELGLRRVSDCELFFLARVLRLDLRDLFPKQMPLKEIGPAFESRRRISLFPARGDR